MLFGVFVSRACVLGVLLLLFGVCVFIQVLARRVPLICVCLLWLCPRVLCFLFCFIDLRVCIVCLLFACFCCVHFMLSLLVLSLCVLCVVVLLCSCMFAFVVRVVVSVFRLHCSYVLVVRLFCLCCVWVMFLFCAIHRDCFFFVFLSCWCV